MEPPPETPNPPAPVPVEAGQPAPAAPLGYDPQNLREFDPAIVLLHLERDGVIVEGPINPFNGDGTHDLLVELQDNLAKARAGVDHSATPAAEIQSVHAGADPNALKRQRAVENGHRFDPDKPGSRCLNCDAAEWATLDGLPCVPKQAEEAA